jgi:hypothetical protein
MADTPEDLSSLTERKQLERIQELLTKQSSDDVRKFLVVNNKYNLNDLRFGFMDELTAKHLLDTPFFNIIGLSFNS